MATLVPLIALGGHGPNKWLRENGGLRPLRVRLARREGAALSNSCCITLEGRLSDALGVHGVGRRAPRTAEYLSACGGQGMGLGEDVPTCRWPLEGCRNFLGLSAWGCAASISHPFVDAAMVRERGCLEHCCIVLEQRNEWFVRLPMATRKKSPPIRRGKAPVCTARLRATIMFRTWKLEKYDLWIVLRLLLDYPKTYFVDTFSILCLILEFGPCSRRPTS